MTPTTIYGVSIRPRGEHRFSSKPRSRDPVRIADRRRSGNGVEASGEMALLGQAFATHSRADSRFGPVAGPEP